MAKKWGRSYEASIYIDKKRASNLAAKEIGNRRDQASSKETNKKVCKQKMKRGKIAKGANLVAKQNMQAV